jgi:hypothetical protein
VNRWEGSKKGKQELQLINVTDACIWIIRWLALRKNNCSSLVTSVKRNWINPLNVELIPTYPLQILLGDLTFMGPCIVSIFQYIYPTTCNVTQFIYIWKLLYVFRVVLPTIIRSVRHPQQTQTDSNSSTIVADSSNGATNTRCCRYRCTRSWWWLYILEYY